MQLQASQTKLKRYSLGQHVLKCIDVCFTFMVQSLEDTEHVFVEVEGCAKSKVAYCSHQTTDLAINQLPCIVGDVEWLGEFAAEAANCVHL